MTFKNRLTVWTGLKEVTVDNIKAKLDTLTEISDDEISALEASIIDTFNEFSEAPRTSESVDAMSELADALDSVRGEVVRREAQAEELEARAAEAANRVHGASEDEAPEEEATDEEKKDDKEETPVKEEEPVVAAAETDEPAVEIATPGDIAENNGDPEVVDAPVADEEVKEEAVSHKEEAVEDAPEANNAEASVEEVVVAVEPDAAPETEASVEEITPVEESTPETAETQAEASVEEVAEVEAPVEAEASIEETTIEPEAQEEAQTVTASAEDAIKAPADRAVDLQVTEPQTAIVAGADIPGVSAGSALSDKAAVAKAMVDRMHTLRRANGGDGEQHTVASFVTEYSDARTLVAGAAEDNGNKIAEAFQEHTALVASGGFGTPTPQTYDIFGFGTDARPVKDSLPKMGADRGSISYIEPPQLADYAGAVGVWTPDMDEAAAGNGTSGADVVKNVLVVQGAQTRYAELDAVTLQLQIGNLLARSYPELVQRHNELALIQHARLAEKTILAKIAAGSTPVTAADARVGFARDFLVTVRRTATQYRSRHRLPLETPLKAIVPNWVYEAIASDLALQMPGDAALGVARAEINGYLSGSNVTFTPSYDLNEFDPQTAGALDGWGTSFDWFLFSEGTWVFLDGGTLDLGIVRDSALVGTNDYRMFVETFEGVAKIGIESLRIRQTFKVSGAASALEDIHS